ncbi:cytochrome P460 family protein [Pikeienuella piscinae]|uniref:Cytochrome P460 family protein n=1 Tax=Pikeienuella piscinae TaxID=2748098 RepID=A0A7L5C0P4_9RHOB|nr:cytochrome P460 family protein [Pikeienuella piscinae]QIE56086.1 cytochrome P460 family protein [Pikeienuella piscinae]
MTGFTAHAVAALSFAIGMSAMIASVPAEAAEDDVALAFPADYKTEFTHYLTADRQNGTQIISIYANDIALNGARGDGKLPYGSILVGELTPALKDADGEPMQSMLGHLIGAEEMAAIAVMQRIEGNDAKWGEDLKVGDWAFDVFSPDGENLGKDTTSCRECHTPLTDSEFLYSYEHLAMKPLE